MLSVEAFHKHLDTVSLLCCWKRQAWGGAIKLLVNLIKALVLLELLGRPPSAGLLVFVSSHFTQLRGSFGPFRNSLSLSLSLPHRCQLVSCLGADFRRGAGVLDIIYESPSQLLTCGYDTFIRYWDLRVSSRYWWAADPTVHHCTSQTHCNNHQHNSTIKYSVHQSFMWQTEIEWCITPVLMALRLLKPNDKICSQKCWVWIP